MIFTGRVRFKDILDTLEVESITGCDDPPNDWIEFFDCVEIDDYDLPECDACGGDGFPEPEDHAVNDWLIRDFISAIQAGDIRTAQCLVGRVFELTDDAREVELTLCQRAA